MKTLNTLSLILTAGFLAAGLSGCGRKDRASSTGEPAGVPPSLQQDADLKKTIVRLDAKEAAELRITVEPVSSEVRQHTLSAPGTVNPAPNHIGIVSAPVDGRVLNLPVQEGQQVRKGQVIMELESLAYGTLVAEYLQALAEVELQANQLQRTEKLVEKKINPEAELEQARAAHTRARALLNAAYAKLKTVGASDGEIDAMQSTERINPRLKIHSPIAGVLDSHKVELGQAVAANERLATVVSLDEVLVKAFLAPEDGVFVKPGDTVRISHSLNREAVTQAPVTTLNPGLDETTRSMVVNVMVRQAEPVLKPGDNVRTEIVTTSPVRVITVSMDAVTYDGNDPVVFVKIADNAFEMRRIRISGIANGSAVVTAGLTPGDSVATGQVFSLKALSRFKLISEE